MTPYPPGSVYRDFFALHPVLRFVRNCVLSIAVGCLFALIVVWP